MPDPVPFRSTINLWGVFFVVVGLWWLLDILGVINVGFDWAIVGALALIVVGLKMLIVQRRW